MTDTPEKMCREIERFLPLAEALKDFSWTDLQNLGYSNFMEMFFGPLGGKTRILAHQFYNSYVLKEME